MFIQTQIIVQSLDVSFGVLVQLIHQIRSALVSKPTVMKYTRPLPAVEQACLF